MGGFLNLGARYSNGIRAGIGGIDRKEFLEDFIIR